MWTGYLSYMLDYCRSEMRGREEGRKGRVEGLFLSGWVGSVKAKTRQDIVAARDSSIVDGLRHR